MGTATIRGLWLSKEHHTGIITVLRQPADFSAPPARLLPSPSVALLRSPSFWRFSSSSHAWSRVSPSGGMTCDAQPTERLTSSSAVSKPTAIVQMTKVQGRRCVQYKTKESRHRQLLSAKQLNKLVKNGETAYLAVVRHTRNITKVKRGKVAAVHPHRAQLKEEGPKKDFATVLERQEEILSTVEEQHRPNLREIYRNSQMFFRISCQ